jgi:hypothetical protein
MQAETLAGRAFWPDSNQARDYFRGLAFRSGRTDD